MVRKARSTWVPEVVKKLEMRASVVDILRGEPVAKQKKNIHRRLHHRLVKHTLQANTKGAYKMRAVLNMLRSSVGRSGKVSTTNWQFVEWDEDEEVILMNWPKKETGSKTPLSYAPGVDWEMDVIHSMATYLVTNEGGAGTRLPGEAN